MSTGLGKFDGSISGARSGNQPLLWLVTLRCQALLHGLDDERPGDGSVTGHLGKAAAFTRRDKFAPRHTLGIGTARQATPVHGLRTDAHAIRKALKTSTLANAFVNQLQIGPYLLSPVARHAFHITCLAPKPCTVSLKPL